MTISGCLPPFAQAASGAATPLLKVSAPGGPIVMGFSTTPAVAGYQTTARTWARPR